MDTTKLLDATPSSESESTHCNRRSRPYLQPPIRLSIIVPTLNESSLIGDTLDSLESLRSRGHEVIVADGGSSDDTLALCRNHADRTISAALGRALQMNAGAQIAQGDVLVFLHADTRLPASAAQAIEHAVLSERRRWGFFKVNLSGGHGLLRIVEALMNLRSVRTGIATGDQTLFVSREVFESIGGFAQIPLMEDIAITKQLKRQGRPAVIGDPVTTSSRYWEEHGILRSVLKMWMLRLAYFMGANPNTLVKQYYGDRV